MVGLVKDSILVVDDDIVFLELISDSLRFEGYDVVTAESGQEALDKSRELFCSLALIDIKLPDFEGLELLRRMEETDPKMRKIIITGYQTLENVKKALELKADAFLTKPVKIEEILKTVKEQLKKRNKELTEKYIVLNDLTQ